MTMRVLSIGLGGLLVGAAVVMAACATGGSATIELDAGARDAKVDVAPEASLGPTTPPGRVSQVAVDGFGSACALFDDGRVYCWGRQFGDGDGHHAPRKPIRRVPERVEGLGEVVQISLGKGRACALGADHHIRCWGAPISPDFPSWSKDIVDPFDIGAERAVRVGADETHVCWVREDGDVLCWGSNLGLSAYPDIDWDSAHSSLVQTPMEIPGVAGALDISVGPVTCALLADGTVTCWGGFLQSDPSYKNYAPAKINNARDVVAISRAGFLSAIAADTSTKILAGWSWNLRPEENRLAKRGSTGAVQLTGSGLSSLVVMSDGSVDYDLYAESDTQLHDPKTLVVADFNSVSNIAYAAVVGYYACFITRDNIVECMGDNSAGQLGDGTTVSRKTVAPVLWPDRPGPTAKP